MANLLKRLERRVAKVERATFLRSTPVDLTVYAGRPIDYASEVLGVELTTEITECLEALHKPPYRVSCDSGHGVGKTFGAAVGVNYWYDTHKYCAVITTAPTERDVIDLLWTEVRLQRQRAKLPVPDDLMPAAPEMKNGPEHYAKGYTARDAASFQGRHRPNMLFVFDEKEGVPGHFWDGAKSMFRPGSGDAWLVIGNPITTTSRAYQEHKAVDAEGNPTWHRVRISSLDHPNIAAGLRGDHQLPVPGAVTAGQMDQWINDWCDPVAPGDRKLTDIEWRGHVYRPGPIGEARILGLRPSSGTFGVWSEAMWAITQVKSPAVPLGLLPRIGCDCANYGVDYTVFHVRCGSVSLFHQAVNGWDHERIAARLMELASEYAAWATARQAPQAAPIRPEQIPIQIDDDSTGRAVSTYLRRNKHFAVPLNAGSRPARQDLYSNIRSELWFQCARKATLGMVNLAIFDRATRQRIEMQAMAPMWAPDAAGRRVVEDKDDLRKPKRLGRSPDDMDALNLAYYEPGSGPSASWGDAEPPANPLRPSPPPSDRMPDEREPEPMRLYGR